MRVIRVVGLPYKVYTVWARHQNEKTCERWKFSNGNGANKSEVVWGFFVQLVLLGPVLTVGRKKQSQLVKFQEIITAIAAWKKKWYSGTLLLRTGVGEFWDKRTERRGLNGSDDRGRGGGIGGGDGGIEVGF
ncbi:hypothetical protein PIB30_013335 [Stylosanthes scabra]|uniref:Uncharacterized protein n=1 Tax=Stylosanthes scabra TaxID=79078 RepID=A0ABU6U984_9FABA|nr:hypothetical protein [Stylosanthes scabra]